MLVEELRQRKEVFFRRPGAQKHQAVQDLLHFASLDEVFGEVLPNGKLVTAKLGRILKLFLLEPGLQFSAVDFRFADPGKNRRIIGVGAQIMRNLRN